MQNNTIKQSVPLPQLSDEMQYQSGVDTKEEHIQWMQSVPRLTLPTKSIDQWSTWVQLPAIYPPTSYTIDGLAIDQLATVVIPVIRKVSGVSNTEAKSTPENYVELIR